MLQAGLRLGKLNQNQFGYEDQRVLDVVMQGHARCGRRCTSATASTRILTRPTTITCAPRSSRRKFAEYGGYDAEARAASILIDAGIDESLHDARCAKWRPV